MNVDDIVKKLVNDFGHEKKKSVKGLSYLGLAEKWVYHMPKEVIKYSTQVDKNDHMHIRLSALKKEQFSHKIGTARVSGWFIKNFPLWVELKKGNNMQNILTQITATPAYLAVVEEMDSNEILESYNVSIKNAEEFDENDDADKCSGYDELQIDVKNLSNYYETTKTAYENGKNGKGMIRHLFDALNILHLANAYDKSITCPLTGKKTQLIPQHYAISSFGRKYYRGNVRLQSCGEVVRRAALGKCTSIDINASVFAYYKTLAIDYDIPRKKAAVLSMIVDQKDYVRQTLADTLLNTNGSNEFKIKIVKTALTSIGFGANINSNYSKTSDVIYNEEDRLRFLAHPIVVELLEVYALITEAVKNTLNKEDHEEDKAYLKSIPNMTDKVNRIKMKSVMAYLYQQEETRIMKKVIEALETETNNEVLLWVHDGIYVKNKPDMGLLSGVLTECNSLMKFDLEKNNKWANLSRVLDIDEEIEAENIMMGKKKAVIAPAYHNAQMVTSSGHFNGGGYDGNSAQDEYDEIRTHDIMKRKF